MVCMLPKCPYAGDPFVGIRVQASIPKRVVCSEPPKSHAHHAFVLSRCSFPAELLAVPYYLYNQYIYAIHFSFRQ